MTGPKRKRSKKATTPPKPITVDVTDLKITDRAWAAARADVEAVLKARARVRHMENALRALACDFEATARRTRRLGARYYSYTPEALDAFAKLCRDALGEDTE